MIDFERIEASAGALMASFQAAEPFRWVALDGFLAEEAAQQMVAEVPGAVERALRDREPKNHQNTANKLGIRKPEHLSAAQRRFFNEIASERFLALLSRITGISPLYADATLNGGGVHVISNGGFLNVHTDFNVHPDTGKHRRLNLLVYLNPTWDDAWGGCLELWPADLSKVAHVISPILNRMVLFETGEGSFHGHPRPLAMPDGVVRQSLAAYFYSDWPAGLTPRWTTNYQPIPA